MAVVTIVFALAAALTWRKWPDLIVDFGAQLYMPWRISAGAVLYRDLFYIGGGPFSQYFNALLFKIFGPSFLTLVTANLILVAATLVLIYRRFLDATNALTATTICLGIVLVFAFNEYTITGNYNYITPYAHEALHGLLLSILTIALLSDWVTKMRLRFAVAAGFCAGLVFLTKPDIFFALAVCAAAGFALFAITMNDRDAATFGASSGFSPQPSSGPASAGPSSSSPERMGTAPTPPAARRQLSFVAKSLVAFITAALLPALFFFLFFLRLENWRESLRSVIFGWLPLFQPGVLNNPFYQWCLGLDEPGRRLKQIAIQSVALFLIVTVYAIALKRVVNLKSERIQSPFIVYLLLISPLVLGAASFDWRSCGAALPFLSLAACALISRNYKKLSARHKPVFPLLWSVFGLVMLSKMGLFPRIWHYGFVLGMPAFVGAIYLLLWLLPGLLEEKFAVPRRYFSATICVPLFIGFGSLFYQSQLVYADKTLPVGQGADRMFTFGPPSQTGVDISRAIDWTQNNVPTNATIAVLPEGVMLNFLTRRVNSTPCLSWEPVIMDALGPQMMTAAFEQHPPDYVFLVERDSSEFGVGYFGSSGFGADVMQWIRQNYQPIRLFGDEPLKNGKFGVEILKRRAARAQNKIAGQFPSG
ncbi:MAG TPA: hypothetical protein VMH30_09615 [Verrucomicrobiae bacterium]|nr:hypothetical protein [Verrucomicrobiae bacterium]